MRLTAFVLLPALSCAGSMVLWVEPNSESSEDSSSVEDSAATVDSAADWSFEVSPLQTRSSVADDIVTVVEVSWETDGVSAGIVEFGETT